MHPIFNILFFAMYVPNTNPYFMIMFILVN